MYCVIDPTHSCHASYICPERSRIKWKSSSNWQFPFYKFKTLAEQCKILHVALWLKLNKTCVSSNKLSLVKNLVVNFFSMSLNQNCFICFVSETMFLKHNLFPFFVKILEYLSWLFVFKTMELFKKIIKYKLEN